MLADLRRPERTFTIRQLCNEFKATPRALRFYEDKGLLTPAREGLNRVYSHKDRVRLQLILRGKRVGALIELREACSRLERRLAEIRPDLLPRAADYDQVLRARLDGHADAALGK
jgi:DNA-binding transcriptional MerR regulator